MNGLTPKAAKGSPRGAKRHRICTRLDQYGGAVMSMSQAFLQEFDHEAKTTRRVLERVPADKFDWKPHPKSMSLGELALHTAMTPGMICGWASEDEFKFTGDKPPVAVSIAEILAAHDSSVAKMKETMGQLGDDGLMKGWKAS